MRPIVRGKAPQKYKKYQDATSDLVRCIGRFCSYCEKPLQNAPEIEHILPKSRYPELENDWDNFLLACKSCNSHKGDAEVVLDNVCLPDRDNTLFAMVYYEGGIIKVNPTMNAEQKRIATVTMELVKLDRYPGYKEPTAKDDRYRQRSEAWGIATRAKHRLVQAKQKHRLVQNSSTDFTDLEDTVVELMCGTGFWSVWMTVFDDDAHMRRRFIDALQGTHKDSFNDATQSISRGKI